MNKEEIFERIKVCEECERDYRKANMLDRACAFNYEKIKWGKILSKLEKVDIYKQALIDIKEYCNSEINEIQNHQYAVGIKRLKKILQIIDKAIGDEK